MKSLTFFICLVISGIAFPLPLIAASHTCLKGDCENGWGVAQEGKNLFEGQFKNGIPCGRGTLTRADGNIISGDKWDKKGLQGDGTETYPNGSSYKGQFQNTRYHGMGTKTNPDGSRHIGEFKDGKPYGQGKFIETSIIITEGQFQDGQVHGKAKRTFNGKLIFEGEFKNNERYGYGTEYAPDGTIHRQGTWRGEQLIDVE